MSDTNDLHGQIGNGSYTVVRSEEQALLAVAVYAKEGFPFFGGTYMFVDNASLYSKRGYVVLVEGGTTSVEPLDVLLMSSTDLEIDEVRHVPLADIKALAQLI